MTQQFSTEYASSSSSGSKKEQIEFGPGDVFATQIQDLVHELRQPLSTIESLAYYLELISRDGQFSAHLQHIQKMVGQANHILEQASVQSSH